MKRFLAAAALACAVLIAATAGSAGTNRTARLGAATRGLDVLPINYGVADDTSKYADDGGSWFYDQLKGAGLTENRWTLSWDASNPSAITELPFLERAAPKAQAAGVHVVLVLQSLRGSLHDSLPFCAWVATVVQTVKQWGINDFIVWNEPNTRRFWTPQKDAAGNDVAAPAYEELLARCYDAIKAANPAALVIGMGLSPRASTSESTEPLVFLRDVGKAYRASGRTKPIMDQLALHPYPNPNSPADSPDVGYQVPDRFGIPNMDRVKQAVYDAFNGTGQPTTVSRPAFRTGSHDVLSFLTFRIDEIGWQVDTTKLPQYVGPENVKTVAEATQTQYLNRMVTKWFACDPTVTDVLLFLLEDEKYRDGKNESGAVVGGGWQSGLITYGGPNVSQPRQAYGAMAQLAAAGRGACTGGLISWKPNTSSGGSGGAGQTAGSATRGDLDGVIDGTAPVEFQKALDNVAAQSAKLPPLPDSQQTTLQSLYNATLNRLLSEAGPAAQNLTMVAGVYTCAECTVSSAVSSGWTRTGRRLAVASAAPRLLASDTTTVHKGSLVKVVIKSKARAKAGKYFVVVVLRAQTDATKKYAFGVQLRSVVHEKAKPKKK